MPQAFRRGCIRGSFIASIGATSMFLSAACSSTGAGSTGNVAVGHAADATSSPATAAAVSTSTTSRASSSGSASPTDQFTQSAAGAPGLDGCPVAPADSIWRARIDRLPVSPHSAAYVASIGVGGHVHADFGSGAWDGGPIGIPITLVPAGTASASVVFDYVDESDKGSYPIPAGALVEGGPQSAGDRHVIAVDPSSCTDYELYGARRDGAGAWSAGSGAVFQLRSDALRPAGWTSADAAGLPILPGLARFEEVAAGTIDHALRITVPRTQSAFVWPARHQASNDGDTALPPMGLRLRLKAGVDISALPPQARVVAQALKTYGAIVADNGSAWYVSGAPDDRWDNDQLHALAILTGDDFEAVNVSSLQESADSAAARQQ